MCNPCACLLIICPKYIRVRLAENMKTKKKAIRRLPANDIDLGKNTLLPDIDNVQVHSKSEKQKESHTLPGNYECGERSPMMICETFGPASSHTGVESSMAIPGMYRLCNF